MKRNSGSSLPIIIVVVLIITVIALFGDMISKKIGLNNLFVREIPTSTTNPTPYVASQIFYNVLAVDKGGTKEIMRLPFNKMDRLFDLDETRGLLYMSDETSQSILTQDLDSGLQKNLYTSKLQDTILSLELSGNNNLFFTETPTDKVDLYSDVNLKLINTDTKAVRTIGTHKPGIYSGFHYLFGDANSDFVFSLGGDGCAAFGYLYRVTSTVFNDIGKIGDGCNPNPSFIGYTNDDLILQASVLKDDVGPSAPPGSFRRYDQLYLFNPQTNQNINILDLKNINGEVQNFVLNQERNKLFIMTSDKFYVFDIGSRSIELEKQHSDLDQYVFFENNKIYFYGVDQKLNMSIFDIQNNKFDTVEIKDDKISKYQSMNILGIWQGKIILVITQN